MPIDINYWLEGHSSIYKPVLTATDSGKPNGDHVFSYGDSTMSKGLPEDAKVFIGTEGNDTYQGNNLSQQIYGLGGNDVLRGGGGNDMINGGSGANQLYGEDGNDQIFGGDDGNLLDGGNNDDYLFGGASIDKANGGLGNDVIFGNGGNDKLNGELGNDRLYGGAGQDILAGGAGNNTFYFDTKLGPDNVDTITDFATYSFLYTNRIGLSSDIFSAFKDGSGPVQFQEGNLHIGTNAQDGDDFIIYDPNSGSLSYDPDGNGAAGQVQFANIGSGAHLSAQLFFTY